MSFPSCFRSQVRAPQRQSLGGSRYPTRCRRCDALVCRNCHAHSSSAHREDCTFPRCEPCHSRWFWLSPTAPSSASPVLLRPTWGWLLARETGDVMTSGTSPGTFSCGSHCDARTMTGNFEAIRRGPSHLSRNQRLGGRQGRRESRRTNPAMANLSHSPGSALRRRTRPVNDAWTLQVTYPEHPSNYV